MSVGSPHHAPRTAHRNRVAQKPSLCHPGSTKYTQPTPRTLVRHPGGVCRARTDKAPLLQPACVSSPASPARHFLRVRSMPVRARTCPYVSVRVRFLVRVMSGVRPFTVRLLSGYYCPQMSRRMDQTRSNHPSSAGFWDLARLPALRFNSLNLRFQASLRLRPTQIES